MILAKHTLRREDVLPDRVPETGAEAAAQARRTLENPHLLRTLPVGFAVTGLLALEQASRAAQIALLSRLSQDVLDHANPRDATVLLMAALGLPQVLQAVRQPFAVLWTTQVRDRYDEAAVVYSFHRPSTWVMDRSTTGPDGKVVGRNVRAERTVGYASNLRWHADNQVKAVITLEAAALGAAMNFVVLGAKLGAAVGVAQVMALALALYYGRQAFNTIGAQSQAQVAADGAVGAHTRRLWDNITLGNANNVARFYAGYTPMTEQADGLARATAKDSAVRDLKLMAWSSGPMLLALALGLTRTLGTQGQGQGALQNLLVQGPAIVAATRNIAGLSETYWNGYRKRQLELTRTLSRLLDVPSLPLAEKSDPAAIRVRQGDVTTTLAEAWPTLLAQAQRGQPGRITVTGQNGAGKSMALLRLKELLPPAHSVLVPAELRDLDFGQARGSTGENDIRAVESALLGRAPVVLLDEWAAHLHPEQMAALSAKIDAAATPAPLGGGGRLVVEITHRHEEGHG